MKITILTPSLNPHIPWLQKAIDSIQGVDEYLLLSEFGSQPKISEIRFPSSIPSIRIINAPEYYGLKKSVEILFNMAEGKWVSFLPDDEYFTENLPQIIERVRNTDADVVHFPCLHMNEEELLPGLFDNVPGITFEENFKGNQFSGTTFFKKEVYDFLYGYQIECCGDWDFWNRALLSGFKFEFVPVPGSVFRYTKHSRMQKIAQETGFEKIRDAIVDNAKKWDRHIYQGCGKK